MAVSSHLSPKPKAPTIEELEQEAHAEMQAHDSKKVVGVVRQWLAKLSNWSDKVFEESLPQGVSLRDYRIIKKMYEKVLEAKKDGEFVKGQDWMRIIPNTGEEKSLSEMMRDNGAIKHQNTKMDILEYLLNRYLPEAMSDRERATGIRMFFASDLGIIAGEIG